MGRSCANRPEFQVPRAKQRRRSHHLDLGCAAIARGRSRAARARGPHCCSRWRSCCVSAQPRTGTHYPRSAVGMTAGLCGRRRWCICRHGCARPCHRVWQGRTLPAWARPCLCATDSDTDCACRKLGPAGRSGKRSRCANTPMTGTATSQLLVSVERMEETAVRKPNPSQCCSIV